MGLQWGILKRVLPNASLSDSLVFHASLVNTVQNYVDVGPSLLLSYIQGHFENYNNQ